MRNTRQDIRNLVEAVNENLERAGSKWRVGIDSRTDCVGLEKHTKEGRCDSQVLELTTTKDCVRYLQGMNRALEFLENK